MLQRHADPGPTIAVLQRGFSGRLLKLYALEQEFLRQRSGIAPEPAYLLLSERQGGFPQVGFYLDATKKSGAGWVDLHRASTLSGRFGAMDQIFPHELLHVMVRQLAGEPRKSGSNQMHAISVRTDPVNAFAEGLAEAIQILAVDDPDAMPETRQLPADAGLLERADATLTAYGKDLTSWWPLPASRLRFLFWFSQHEQVLRYHAVKANRFARMPVIPDALLARGDKFGAYLFANVMPGEAGDTAKPATVMLSSEGVVSFLFWRFLTDPALQQSREPEAFYAQFGTSPAEVGPLENVCLKMFAALAAGRPSTSAELLRAYITLFPADAAAVEGIVRDALLGQALPDSPEIWLANEALVTGTSLFDQFRTLPRPHTFDANAATLLDWLSVPGMTTHAASVLLAGAPYRSIDDVRKVSAVTPEVSERIDGMAAAMDRLRSRAVDEEETLSLSTILISYLWRISVLIFACTLGGAWLSKRAGTRRTWAALAVAFASSVLVLVFSWAVTGAGWLPFVVAPILGGVPLMLWRLIRRRLDRPVYQALAIWAAASVPALLLVTLT